MRIIFMGTPEFAVPSLEALVKNNLNVVAVVTAPDKPAGRGLKLKSSPVKETALKYNIPVLQPASLKSEEFITELKSYRADLQIVVAFRMLPESVWGMPPKGTFNLHASLLPQYRGAAPINWAIINGEKETGTTTFFLKHDIDTGDILFSEKEIITSEDNAGSLYERLMHKGAALVVKTVKAILGNTIRPLPQPTETVLKNAPKIHKETCRIDWTKSAEEIYNFIRGLSPYPGAWTILNGKELKVFSSSCLEERSDKNPGDFTTDNKSFLKFSTGTKIITIHELQMEGKKKMAVDEFLRGNKLQ